MKVLQKNIKPGYQMQNESNNHRILCVDAKPIFVGFIGKDLIITKMDMHEAIEWLYASVSSKDTVCASCASALCTRQIITAAEGHLFCNRYCARQWKRNELIKGMDLELDLWESGACEDVSAVSCGVTDEDIFGLEDNDNE